jgi:ADP-ribose pyrophosphatase
MNAGQHSKGERPEFEIVGERTIHEGRVFRLLARSLRLASGKRQDVDVILHPGAVAIAARDETGRMLLVRQIRAALGGPTLEVPAGRLEPGEAPIDAARRELEEETGIRAGSWRRLCSIVPAPGFCSEVLHLFEARELETIPGGGRGCDADEELEVVWREPSTIHALDPVDAKTLICALLLGGFTPGRDRGP